MRRCLYKIETKSTIISKLEREDPLSLELKKERKEKLRKAFETISACFVYTLRGATTSIDVWGRCTPFTMPRTTLSMRLREMVLRDDDEVSRRE